MRRRLLIPMVAMAFPLAALAGCQTAPESGAAAAPGQAQASAGSGAGTAAGVVDTHEAMVRWLNPAATAIWDVSNNAMGDTGELDAALMDDAAWTRMADAARLLDEHSMRMAQAQTLTVGAHNDAIEGFATKAEIQAMIDADPEGYRQLSREMAEHARALAAAAGARDAARAGALSDSLSERCQACHTRYWEKPA